MAEPSLTPDVDVNESFSALYKSSEQNITLKVGPWGGSGNSSFDIGESTSQLIKKVIVNAGDVVDSLEIDYFVDGNTVTSYQAGGTGGDPYEFKLDLNKGEYISQIFGSVNDYNGETCVTEIGFKTNLGEKQHGPYGKGGGVGFTIPVVNGRIVGFFGQYNNYINGIGVSLLLN